MIKKWIMALLVLSISFSMTSCKIPIDINKNDIEDTNTAIKKNKDDVMDKGPVRGGTINLFSTVPDTLNPILTQNAYVQDFSGFIFESLVKLDRNQNPQPQLADKWEVSSDGLTWTFHIRGDVLWHDNMPLTAEDVEFTVSTILNQSINSVYKRNVQNFTTFAAIDRSSFRVILKKPDSFTAELMTFPIIPKHYFLGEDMSKTPRNMKPLGTGPYKFVSYTEGSSIILNTNDIWWQSKSNEKGQAVLPYIGEINVKIFDKGKDSINAFQNRDTDITYIEAADCSKYTGRSDLIIKKYPGRNFEFVTFNLSKPALADKAVRQAIAFTLNKSRIVNDLLPGAAIAADLPLIPDTWLYDSNIVSYTASPAKAKEILAQDGWKDSNGILYKNINGVYAQLNLEMLINDDNGIREKVAEEIKQQMAEIGINLQIKKIGWDEEFKLINTRKFDMALLGWSIASTPDVSFAYSTPEIATGRNVSGYSNPQVDIQLQQLLSENDSSKKKMLFQSLKTIINDDVPYIGLYFYNNALLFNKRVRGDMNPYVWDKYNDITKWYIPVR